MVYSAPYRALGIKTGTLLWQPSTFGGTPHFLLCSGLPEVVRLLLALSSTSHQITGQRACTAALAQASNPKAPKQREGRNVRVGGRAEVGWVL